MCLAKLRHFFWKINHEIRIIWRYNNISDAHCVASNTRIVWKTKKGKRKYEKCSPQTKWSSLFVLLLLLFILFRLFMQILLLVFFFFFFVVFFDNFFSPMLLIITTMTMTTMTLTVANYKTKTNQVISLSFFLFLGFHSNFEYFSIDSFGIYLHDFNFFSFSRVLVFKITITLNNSMLNGI